MQNLRRYNRLTTAYSILIEDAIVVSCCEERKKQIEKEYRVTVLSYGENLKVSEPHCGFGCIKGFRTGI